MGNSSLRRRRKRTKIFGDEYHVILLRFRKTEKEKEEKFCKWRSRKTMNEKNENVCRRKVSFFCGGD